MLSEKELVSIVQNDILNQIARLDEYGFSLKNVQSILESIQQFTIKKGIDIAYSSGVEEGLHGEFYHQPADLPSFDPVLTPNNEGVEQHQKVSDEPLPPNGEYDSMADEDEDIPEYMEEPTPPPNGEYDSMEDEVDRKEPVIPTPPQTPPFADDDIQEIINRRRRKIVM